jgi:hypothetical protein
MPLSQFIFFAAWLVAALVGGLLLVFVWERLRAKHSGAATPDRPAIRS